jgi:thiosulfate dehydrogenase [quinone] large subunit
MGPLTEVAVPPTAAASSDDHEESLPPASIPADTSAQEPRNLRLANWLFRSSAASVIWLAVRLWLGYSWMNAGYQKIWGSEKSAFWFGGGVGVKGFATAGVVGSTTGKGGASYGWWAAFLHNFVIPNASWIGKFIALGELAIGIALVLGLFTGVAALAGITLNLTYMFTGSAGVNPMYALASVGLILAWRNAGALGLDRFVLRGAWRNRQAAGPASRALHRRTTVPARAHSEEATVGTAGAAG